MKLEVTPQVWAITGNLGGGKTLTAVHLGVNAMREGYFVVSNITFDVDEICRVFGKSLRGLYKHINVDDPDFNPFELPTGSPRGSGGGKRVLVILDECAEWFDQYQKGTDPRIQNLMSWLRHSSKRSQDVMLVVQRVDFLQKSFRSLVSKWVIVDDLAFWRIPIIKIKMPFMQGFVMQRHFSGDKKLLGGPYYVNKSMWGRFYNTAECLNTEGAATCYEYTVPAYHPPFPWLLFLLYLLSVILIFS